MRALSSTGCRRVTDPRLTINQSWLSSLISRRTPPQLWESSRITLVVWQWLLTQPLASMSLIAKLAKKWDWSWRWPQSALLVFQLATPILSHAKSSCKERKIWSFGTSPQGKKLLSLNGRKALKRELRASSLLKMRDSVVGWALAIKLKYMKVEISLSQKQESMLLPSF